MMEDRSANRQQQIPRLAMHSVYVCVDGIVPLDVRLVTKILMKRKLSNMIAR